MRSSSSRTASAGSPLAREFAKFTPRLERVGPGEAADAYSGELLEGCVGVDRLGALTSSRSARYPPRSASAWKAK